MNTDNQIPQEFKTCDICGQELPLSAFRKYANGTVCKSCKKCLGQQSANVRGKSYCKRSSAVNVCHDEMFDGQPPVYAISIMTRAKRWLESQGYEINLSGFHKKVVITPVKFQ